MLRHGRFQNTSVTLGNKSGDAANMEFRIKMTVSAKNPADTVCVFFNDPAKLCQGTVRLIIAVDPSPCRVRTYMHQDERHPAGVQFLQMILQKICLSFIQPVWSAIAGIQEKYPEFF